MRTPCRLNATATQRGLLIKWQLRHGGLQYCHTKVTSLVVRYDVTVNAVLWLHCKRKKCGPPVRALPSQRTWSKLGESPAALLSSGRFTSSIAVAQQSQAVSSHNHPSLGFPTALVTCFHILAFGSLAVAASATFHCFESPLATAS